MFFVIFYKGVEKIVANFKMEENGLRVTATDERTKSESTLQIHRSGQLTEAQIDTMARKINEFNVRELIRLPDKKVVLTKSSKRIKLDDADDADDDQDDICPVYGPKKRDTGRTVSLVLGA